MWQSDASSSACPLTIPFALIFPTTYQDGGQEYSLPPTFESVDSPASCSYTLTVSLSKPRQLLSFLTQNETLSIPLQYYPRSRPHSPMLPNGLSFMSTVKSSPEEWHQVMCTMNSVPSSGILFIPSVQVFALTDTIPFHLQLRAPMSSLSAFISHVSSPTGSNSSSGISGATVRVYLSRQMTVKVGDQKNIRKRVLGEGTLRALSSSSEVKPLFRHSSSKDGLDTLDWEGEVQCSREITTPAFCTPQFAVKSIFSSQDSIVLLITPPQPLTSPLLRLHHEHSIRLVTDPWSDRG
ncbi:hypothetical protein SERLADRAFT_362165 [Serpula lacrymans var. lacrymans S7.9]|uniref:Arrestin-like N-terminal domain-containing protein n=1 Tax=Serpula lacrymans var. lacrymans (strain S7.9) TaxID=578457 RepID=F8P034_SERL9|nr:uncharacterized protein SERLADRAFT_362165 [Serpula lacrymans var. lacrymans S7.9]EGO24101.1 hypothetical protein SERLADRAFT_362165 [Serpula lacrymans var. lacrymans S7.9]